MTNNTIEVASTYYKQHFPFKKQRGKTNKAYIMLIILLRDINNISFQNIGVLCGRKTTTTYLTYQKHKKLSNSKEYQVLKELTKQRNSQHEKQLNTKRLALEM
jgi:hypothetical protein